MFQDIVPLPDNWDRVHWVCVTLSSVNGKIHSASNLSQMSATSVGVVLQTSVVISLIFPTPC